MSYSVDNGRDLIDGNGIGFCDDGLEGPRLSWTGHHETREMSQHLVVVAIETMFGVEEDIDTTKSNKSVQKEESVEKGLTVSWISNSHPACAPIRVYLSDHTQAHRRERGSQAERRRGKSSVVVCDPLDHIRKVGERTIFKNGLLFC